MLVTFEVDQLRSDNRTSIVKLGRMTNVYGGLEKNWEGNRRSLFKDTVTNCQVEEQRKIQKLLIPAWSRMGYTRRRERPANSMTQVELKGVCRKYTMLVQ